MDIGSSGGKSYFAFKRNSYWPQNSRPCDQYSYTGLHDKLRMELYLYAVIDKGPWVIIIFCRLATTKNSNNLTINTILPHRTSAPRPTQIQFPSPIIAILTAYLRPLSAFLYSKEMNARPITWPTVCLHAGNSWSKIDRLIEAILEWAVDIVVKSKREAKPKVKKEVGKAVRILMESKLWLRFIRRVEVILLWWTYRVHDFSPEMLRSRVCCFKDILRTRLRM